MAASIRFDQVGIAASSGPGARTDGVATGGRVTVRNDSGRPCRIELIGIPPDDTSVIGSIGQDSSDQYHFDPTAARYGSYLIRLIEGEGTLDQTIDEKVFGIRLPNSGLLIPAFNEKGDPLVTFADSIERKDKAATITHNNEAGPGGFKWLGWFKSLRELFIAVENGGGGGGGGGGDLPLAAQSIAGNATGSTANAAAIAIAENQLAGRAVGGNVAGNNLQAFTAIDTTAGAGNIRTKIAPQIYVAVAALATAANANHDIPLSEDGYYQLHVIVLLKLATAGTYRRIGFVVDATLASSAVTLQGAPERTGGGDSTGIALTVTASGSNVRVNIANSTGESVSGRIHAGHFVEDAI